jgi:abnormal spindle-like microcephaly-associated protein
MVQQQAVPILFSVIRGCNRSKPHMQLLQHSLDILLHLARTRYTSHAVFSADCLDLLVEQLQMYRDQEDIFMRAMALMNLMAKHHRNILKTELGKNGGALFKRMKGIATVMERKYQIEKKYLQSCNLMNASKINSSKMDTSRMNVSTTQSARIANSNSVVLCYESIARFLIDISKN